MSSTFAGYQCWQQERIGIVINKEALSVDRANFLATHVPMRRIVDEGAPRSAQATSESGLLAELNRKAAADEHVFAVVKGMPGTGKSHLIRWLREQYKLAHPQEAVLLIARANSSLQSTIQQIVADPIFAGSALPESLQRLNGALEVLSSDTLAEQLLASLQIATRTLDYEEIDRQLGGLHRRLSPDKIEKFLLDYQVRQQLKAPDGSLARVTTFLTSGTGTNEGVNQFPGFAPDDFLFSADFRRQLHNGGAYREVLNLCDDLAQRADIRESLAGYLTYTLHRFAIGHATQLAAGDLRTMFADLRRWLHRQGKTLALFIEDISAFTGIDQGLVEVLITQHRGEANAEYCRLLSVIGITDAWYTSYLPDNIKERITHRLALNATTGRTESELLQAPGVLAEFGAHYLNAMRVTQPELEAWAMRGAQLDALPNACDHCPHRRTCHQAFGAVELTDATGAPVQTIGLYPFNAQALQSCYSYLREGVGKTPRSLLNSILAYILQVHGPKLALGEFPPPPTELAGDVTIPNFDPPAHDLVVNEQGGDQAQRLKTLFLYWGNRSVNASGAPGSSAFTVGGLSADVWRAFRLRGIAGIATQVVPPPPPGPEAKQQKPELPEQPSPRAPGKSAPVAPAPAMSRFTDAINNWANGERLFGFDRFADWIADLARSFIDWQAHNVSASRVDEYVVGGRMYIESQSGQMNPGRLYLRFERSDKYLRPVLQALADLNDPNYKLTPDEYGEHLATLSHWLHVQEPRFVAFVREPSGLAVDPDYLTHRLLEQCVLLAALEGKLTPAAATDPLELYQQVIATCAASTESHWNAAIERLRPTYPAPWIALMRKVNAEQAVHRCRTELLQLLNRPQGASTNVRFLDAATAVRHLRDFSARNWTLAPLPVRPASNDLLWSSVSAVHDALADKAATVWQAAQVELARQHQQVKEFLEPGTPEEALAAIKTTLRDLREVRQYASSLDTPFVRNYAGAVKPADLQQWLDGLAEQLALPTGCRQIAGLASGFAVWQAAGHESLRYFTAVAKALSEQEKQFTADIKLLMQSSQAEQEYATALNSYDVGLQLLAPYAETEQMP